MPVSPGSTSIKNGHQLDEHAEMMGISLRARLLACVMTMTCVAIAHAAELPVRINDTGQTVCHAGAGNVEIIEIDCNDPDWPGQDGVEGRDRLALAGALPRTGQGRAGFDFTKLSDTGAELPDSALPGRHPGAWTCTRDNVTGLVWQITPSHEVPWHGLRTALMDPRTVRGLCGRHDWRLPNQAELFDLVDLGTDATAIDADFFPDTGSLYWSGPVDAPRVVNFDGGFSHPVSVHATARVRRVSGGETFAPVNHADDGTRIDPRTGLAWDSCALGQDPAADCVGEVQLMTWQQALQTVQERNAQTWRGHSDWRLPNAKELASLIDPSARYPAIDTGHFPNTAPGAYWTSTSYAREPRMAWAIFFGAGDGFAKDKSTQAAVRLVRTDHAATTGTGPLPAPDLSALPIHPAPEPNLSSLPTLHIDTLEGAAIGRYDYVQASMVLDATAETPAQSGSLLIRGRGNSTWQMPKKPYKLKLDKKTALLGMAKSKHWALLANHSDKSMLRTRLAMAMGERLGMAWSPQSRFVRVELNGQYEGIYLLSQTIRIGEDRVDITAIDSDDTDGVALTGGYLFEIDARLNCDPLLQIVTSGNVKICIDDPDEDAIVPQQFAYLVDYLDAMEAVLNRPDFADPVKGYPAWLNPDSFIDWYLVNELTANTDAREFSSIWNYKDRGGRIERGPLWDFDLSSGNGNQRTSADPTGFWIRGGIWYKRLFQDPAFVAQVRSRWDAIKADWIESLPDWLDAQADILRKDVDENFERWPTLAHYAVYNVVVTGSWEGELAYLKDWLRQRSDWLERNIEPPPGPPQASKDARINTFDTPVADKRRH